jgi:prefoldin subunit 5
MRSLRNIRTAGSLADRCKTRNRAGALLELSALSSEKERLRRELRRWEQRKREIDARLAEIQEKERRLEAVAGATGPAAVPVAAGPDLRVNSFEY